MRTVAGSSGSRVVASVGRAAGASGPGARPASTSRRRSPSAPRPRAPPAHRRRSARVSRPLPMSCSSAATISTSGRATRRIRPGRLDAGLDHVPVDGEPVHDRGVRQQPDLLPLGQELRRAAPVSSRVSQTASSPGPAASSRTNRSRASSGHGSGSGGHSRTSRAAVAGASTRPRSAASAAARSSSTGRRPGRARARPARPRLARARPRARRRPARGRRAPGTGGRASTASARRQVSRDRCVIRRPIARVWRCAAVASGSPSSVRDVAPVLRRHPVGGAAGDCVQRRRARRAAPAGSARGRTCGTSTSQRRHERLEHGRVAQPAHRLLEVGDRGVRQLPEQVGPAGTSSCSSGSRSRASRRHWVSSAVRSRSVRFGSPARCRASSSPSATRRSADACSAASGRVRTEWSMFAPESHSGYQIVARPRRRARRRRRARAPRRGRCTAPAPRGRSRRRRPARRRSQGSRRPRTPRRTAGRPAGCARRGRLRSRRHLPVRVGRRGAPSCGSRVTGVLRAPAAAADPEGWNAREARV